MANTANRNIKGYVTDVLGYGFVFTFVIPLIPFLMLEAYQFFRHNG